MSVWARCIEPRMGDVWQALGRAANLVVLDFSDEPARERVLHFRPWCADGYATSVVRTVREIDNVALVRLRANGAGLLVVRGAGDDVRPAEWLTQGLRLLGPRAWLIEADGDGQLLIDGRLVTANMPPWAIWRKGVTVEARGANVEKVQGAALPLALAVDTLSADATSSLLTIAVTGLPASTFYCPPGARGVVEISVQPGLEHDVPAAIWRQAGTERPMPLVTADLAAAPAAPPGPLTDLAVVLDRTCPDNEHWYPAYAVAYGLRRAANDWDDASAEVSATELNAGIRAGLLNGIARALQDGKIEQVALWWSADRASEKLGNCVDGNEPPATDFGGSGATAEMGACRAFFASAGYTSGLDLFDPIDKALAAAAAELPATARRAILVVGNSPPPPPASGIDEESPLEGISSPAWLPRRVRSTNRHGYGVWEETVARCRDAGIAVHYLFLQHDRFQTAKQRAQSNYLATQRRVMEAIKATVPTTGMLATQKEIEDGFDRAIETLAAEHDRPSRVRISRIDSRQSWHAGR